VTLRLPAIALHGFEQVQHDPRLHASPDARCHQSSYDQLSLKSVQAVNSYAVQTVNVKACSNSKILFLFYSSLS